MRKAGWKVIVTSNSRKTANTRGTPDVYVFIGIGFWIALEIKSPDGKASKEQTELEKIGAVKIVRSKDECIEYVVEKANECIETKKPSNTPEDKPVQTAERTTARRLRRTRTV